MKVTNPLKHNTNDTLVAFMMPPHKVSKHDKGYRASTVRSKTSQEVVSENVVDLTQGCGDDDFDIFET